MRTKETPKRRTPRTKGVVLAAGAAHEALGTDVQAAREEEAAESSEGYPARILCGRRELAPIIGVGPQALAEE